MPSAIGTLTLTLIVTPAVTPLPDITQLDEPGMNSSTKVFISMDACQDYVDRFHAENSTTYNGIPYITLECTPIYLPSN